MQRTTGIVIIATGKYFQFVQPLVNSIHQWFHIGSTTPVVLTDSPEPLMDCIVLPAKHRPWPQATLNRYSSILEREGMLRTFDYLYHLDADLRVIAPIGEEIIGDRVSTISPIGYDWPKEKLPFERNPISAAYVPEGQGERYFTGSLNGGRSGLYLDMLKSVTAAIAEDDKIGYVARLHEESHLNKFYLTNPPDVVLSPEYCCPEHASLRPKYSRRLILTLDKPLLDKEKGSPQK